MLLRSSCSYTQVVSVEHGQQEKKQLQVCIKFKQMPHIADVLCRSVMLCPPAAG